MFQFLASHRSENVPFDSSASNIDDYDDGPFEIVCSSRQLAHIVRQAAEARLPVTLNSPHLAPGMPSRLLGIEAHSGAIFVRQLLNEQLHAALISDRRFNLLIKQKESTLLLSLTLDRLDQWNRQDCYVATLPPWALSSQMRAWRRTHLPETMALFLVHRFPDNERLEARIADISEGGLSLVVPHLPLRGIRLHERWPHARLAYGKTEIGPLDLQVRHLRNEAGTQHIGLKFEQASEGQCQHLRRLLLRLQSTPH